VELVLATQKLTDPGGAPTYALTLAEHLARLGHAVTLYARELGTMAEVARDRALRVTGTAEELPAHADGVISGVDGSLALELAGRYPQATRLFVVHGSEDIHLPPPVVGAVAATIVLNDRHALRAAACAGAGEVVRLRQPVDLRRFSPSGHPAERPRRVLLLGNYHSSGTGQRTRMLLEAWASSSLEWREAGGDSQTLAVPEAIAQADIVVGYGRSVLEAMSCGRPAYVHDHSGSEGWITPDSYPQLEAGGFAVAAARMPPGIEELRADLVAYRPEWGLAGHDIARAHHDARDHAAAVVALIERMGSGRALGEPSAVRAMAQLAESQLRAELTAEHYRKEAKQWFSLYNGTLEEMARARGEWDTEREASDLERARSQAEQAELRGAAAETAARLSAFTHTRRFRFAQALARPLDRLRARMRGL
jgi:hypothetical protein